MIGGSKEGNFRDFVGRFTEWNQGRFLEPRAVHGIEEISRTVGKFKGDFGTKSGSWNKGGLYDQGRFMEPRMVYVTKAGLCD